MKIRILPIILVLSLMAITGVTNIAVLYAAQEKEEIKAEYWDTWREMSKAAQKLDFYAVKEKAAELQKHNPKWGEQDANDITEVVKFFNKMKSNLDGKMIDYGNGFGKFVKISGEKIVVETGDNVTTGVVWSELDEKKRVSIIKIANLAKTSKTLAIFLMLADCPDEARKVLAKLEIKNEAGHISDVLDKLYDPSELGAAALLKEARTALNAKKYKAALEKINALKGEEYAETKFVADNAKQITELEELINKKVNEDSKDAGDKAKRLQELADEQAKEKERLRAKRLKEIGWIEDDFDAAVAKAKREKKDIIVLFTGSDWCGWCIRLHNEVLKVPEFIENSTKTFVLVSLDFPRRKKQDAAVALKNQALLDKFGVRGFPTVFLCKSNGTPYFQTGYVQNRNTWDKYLEYLLEAKKAKK